MNKINIILLFIFYFHNCKDSNNDTNENSINEIEYQNPVKSESKNIKHSIETLKKEYCFKSIQIPNNSFIKRSKSKEDALKEFKYIFREKDQGDFGNLKKIKLWASNNEWGKIHSFHYDWWMFPSDRSTSGYKMKFAFDKQLLKELLKDKSYIDDYLEGVRLVLLAWGWDLKNKKFIDNPHPDQKWDSYSIRLLKIIYSLILLEQVSEYDSVCKFVIAIIKRDHKGIPYEDKGDWKLINIYAEVKERLKKKL